MQQQAEQRRGTALYNWPSSSLVEWDIRDSKLCQLIIRVSDQLSLLGISRNHLFWRENISYDKFDTSPKTSFNINLALVLSLNQPVRLA